MASTITKMLDLTLLLGIHFHPGHMCLYNIIFLPRGVWIIKEALYSRLSRYCGLLNLTSQISTQERSAVCTRWWSWCPRQGPCLKTAICQYSRRSCSAVNIKKRSRSLLEVGAVSHATLHVNHLQNRMIESFPSSLSQSAHVQVLSKQNIA